MPTMSCPRCSKTINKIGSHRHLRFCKGPGTPPPVPVAAPLAAAVAALRAQTPADHRRGMATLEFGAFRREFAFADLADLRLQLTTLQFELADSAQLLGIAASGGAAPRQNADAAPALAAIAARPRRTSRIIRTGKPATTSAPSVPLALSVPLAPSASITERALARCEAELANPLTNDGRRAVLRTEIATLKTKLATAAAQAARAKE